MKSSSNEKELRLSNALEHLRDIKTTENTE